MPFGNKNNVQEFKQIISQPQSVENLKKLQDMFGFLEPKSLLDIVNDCSNNGQLNGAFEKAGFHETGATRQYSVFLVWLTGAKNLSIEDALKLDQSNPDYKNYVNEFQRFLVDHPVKTQNAADNKKNVKAWTNLYIKSANKLNEYKFPDIDYTNPNEVKKHNDVLGTLLMIQIDVCQEFELLTSNEREAYAQEEAGGADKLKEAMNPWLAIQDVAVNYKSAYMPEKFNENVFSSFASKNYGVLEPTVNARNLFRYTSPLFKGKTVKQYVADKKKKDQISGIYNLYLISHQASSTKQTYDIDKMVAYCSGVNKDIEKDYDAKNQSAAKQARRYLNSGEIQSSGKNFLFNVSQYAKKVKEDPSKEFIPVIFGNGSDSPKDMLDTLNSKEGEELRTLMTKSFDNILNYTPASAEFVKALGIKDELELFKIDGKSVQEKWNEEFGSKWGREFNLLFDNQKKTLLKAFVLKEMLYGRSDITIDVYAINDNDQIVKTDPLVVAKSPSKEVQTFPFYRAVNELHKKLDDQLTILKNTQDDPDKNFVRGRGTEGSPEYRAMVEALKKCVDYTDLNQPKGSMANLGEAMSELKKAAAKYYKSHANSLFKGHSVNKGQVRVNSSDLFRGDFLGLEYKTLKELCTLTDIKPNELMDASLENTSILFKDSFEKLQTMSNMRGSELNMERVNNPNHLADKIYDLAESKKELRTEVNDALKGALTNTEKATRTLKNMDLFSQSKDYLSIAKKIAKNEYYKLIKNAGPEKNISMDELRKVILAEDFSQKIHKRVSNILDDNKFIELVEKDPANCVAKYEALVQKRNKSYHEFNIENNPVYATLANKYPDPNVCEFKWSLAEEQLSAWQKEMNLENDNIVSIRSYALDNKDAFNAANLKPGDKKDNPVLIESAHKLDYIKDKFSRIVTLSIMKDEINQSQNKEETGMMKAINPEEFKKTQKLVLKSLENDPNLFKRDANAFTSGITLLWPKIKENTKNFLNEERAKEAEKAAQAQAKKGAAKKPAAGKK